MKTKNQERKSTRSSKQVKHNQEDGYHKTYGISILLSGIYLKNNRPK